MLSDSLNSIRKRIGLTDTEIKIILFLAGVFIVGLGIKIALAGGGSGYKNFEYSKADNLYFLADSLKNQPINTASENVDTSSAEYKLMRRENSLQKSKVIPGEKSININLAGVEELTRLPGIGAKTAEKIIEYRNTHGKFKSVKELLEVKGIGEKKLEKIKKIIFIE